MFSVPFPFLGKINFYGGIVHNFTVLFYTMKLKLKKLKKIKKSTLIIAAVLIALAVAIAVAQILINSKISAKSETVTYAMGTAVEQTVYGNDCETATENGAQAAEKLESLLSWKLEDSDIYKINANAGKDWTEVSATTENILNQALDVCKESGGAFDITILPLSNLWGFENSPSKPPSDEMISKVLEKIDYSALRYDADNSSYSFKSSGYALDLSAVGNGAACDVIIAEYKALDVDRAMVSVGGSIGVYSTGDYTWTIGIENSDSSKIIGKVKITSGYCSTSGTAKNFEYDGKTYHHILDTKTGYPVETDLASVTVFCDNGTISDALATACFCLGYEESQSLLEKYDAEAVFVYNDDSVKVTSNLNFVSLVN